MRGNSSNRQRAFADVVSVDAWHDDFTEGTRRVDFHADVVFGTARVGGEPESPVRFRLSVKRAEVVIVISDFEPVKVDPRSVLRDSPEREGRLVETTERSAQASVKGKLGAAVSQTRMMGEASVAVDGSATTSSNKKLEVASSIRFLMTTQSKTSEGHYRWAIEPQLGNILGGRPWDPAAPRAKLIDMRADQSKGVPPTVRVDVRCRREDLVIEDLELKDENLWQEVKRRAGFKNRVAAAVSYIRDRLHHEGLEVANIEDPFGHLTLGSVIAESS